MPLQTYLNRVAAPTVWMSAMTHDPELMLLVWQADCKLSDCLSVSFLIDMGVKYEGKLGHFLCILANR